MDTAFDLEDLVSSVSAVVVWNHAQYFVVQETVDSVAVQVTVLSIVLHMGSALFVVVEQFALCVASVHKLALSVTGVILQTEADPAMGKEDCEM